MILDKIILHDFGVFGDYHEIDLTPPTSLTPIILFGGLNGTGKTTLLDALQLCLFGQVAHCFKRTGTGYPDFLRKYINKHSKWKQASLGLDFRHVTQGNEDKYCLRRTWKVGKNNVNESFEVIKNSLPDPTLSQNWLQYVEDIIPANISHLFFFDGEQAENYAMPDNSSELVRTGILNLLGMDVVTRLINDLKVLERKTKVVRSDSDQLSEIEFIEKTIAIAKTKISELQQQYSMVCDELEIYRKQLIIVEEEFQNIGGNFYENKTELEEKAKVAEDEFTECAENLRKLASGCLPLYLNSNLLNNYLKRNVKEQEILRAMKSPEIIEKYHRNVIKHLSKKEVTVEVIELLEKFNEKELRKLNKLARQDISYSIDEATELLLNELQQKMLPEAKENTIVMIRQYVQLKQNYDASINDLACIPKQESIIDTQKHYEQLKEKIVDLENSQTVLNTEIEREEREIARNQSLLETLITAEAEKKIEVDDNERLIYYSSKARTTLGTFSGEVIKQHISNIEHLVLESYQNLLRKSSLIGQITIDPNDFSINLRDTNGKEIPPDRLSAGERQLLAISLLWGMAKASGRPLPTAIDTPLGRLDATHREHLVKRYFPYASHQVLLFSTDQELHSEYLDIIKHQIGRNYLLNYEDTTGNTTITEGYFAT